MLSVFDWERALYLLAAFVDEETCSFDHHGSCQTHWCQEVDGGRCGNAQAREFLNTHHPRWNK